MDSTNNSYIVFSGCIDEMIPIKAGVFEMGNNQSNFDYEKPAHQVRLDSFSLGKFQVTQQLWEIIMGFNPSRFKGKYRPVESVSWTEAHEFLDKLNSMVLGEGEKSYRLPSEAEWEYAARAGNIYIYSGSNVLGEVGWFSKNSQKQTHEVGLKVPNEWGLYDMSGNVFEWCQDGFKEDYYKYRLENDGIISNPQGPKGEEQKVARGGSWAHPSVNGSVFARNRNAGNIKSSIIGLRLCR